VAGEVRSHNLKDIEKGEVYMIAVVPNVSED
jgi:hypothetical protein